MENSALVNEFLVESFENLSSINNDLTQIEKEPANKELLNNIYRTVHTLKGSASFLGLKKLMEITHSAENLLDELRDEKFCINSSIIDTLLETFDICNAILSTIEACGEEGDSDIEKNKSLLEKLLETKGVLEIPNQIIEKKIVDSEHDQSHVNEMDDELFDLLSEHRIDDIHQENKNIKPSAKPDESNDNISAAALESIKELVASGQVDASILEGLDTSDIPVDKVKEKPEVVALPEQASSKVSGQKEQIESAPKFEHQTTPEVDEKKTASLADSFVRVNVKVLDKIMNIVGELVLNRNQIVQYSNSKSEHEFTRLSQQLNIITSELQSEVMSTRMQPVGSILSKFERLVRDFSRQSGKNITLKLSGTETELDKTLIEAIKDPLVHIVRNACDHGIETIEERKISGKNGDGILTIKSYNESGQVMIEIVDNGRGLNRDKIGHKAIEKGVIDQDQFSKMSDTQVYGLIFAPGFSTAEQITNISGRGVGMDVVKTNIEKIGGSVTVSSILGVGTTFKLRIPLTLAIVPALIIKSKGESFAIPQLNLNELVRLETHAEKMALEEIQGSEFLKLRGTLTPVFKLSEILQLDQIHERKAKLKSVIDSTLIVDSNSLKNKKLNSIDDAYNIVIMTAENLSFGIIVDEILDTEEIVVKPLDNRLKHIPMFGGATIMGDGQVALILDAVGFINTVCQSRNLTPETDVLNIASETLHDQSTDKHESLLFKLHDNRVYALPLSLVARLEEFKFSDIEKTGNQPIVRYLNAPMPLINLERSLGLKDRSALEGFNKQDGHPLSCIVATIRGANYGLVVKEVLDISMDDSAIDDIAVDRDGILGTVFINDRTVSLIDIFSIIDAQKIGKKAKNNQDRRGGKPAKNHSVLVVDDSPMYRKMVSDLLKEEGYQTSIACHGQEALDLMQKNNYDLVITDIEMPILDGYSLARKVRNDLKNKNQKILALSTKCSEEDKAIGKEAGFNFHLEKFKREDIIEQLNEIFGGI